MDSEGGSWRVDGAGWVRAVVEALDTLGSWVTRNATIIALMAAALMVGWLLLRWSTRP